MRVSSTPQTQAKIMLHFEVEDTGPGIPEDEVSKLFEIFTQGKVGQNAVDGVGLGLPIDRKSVV